MGFSAFCMVLMRTDDDSLPVKPMGLFHVTCFSTVCSWPVSPKRQHMPGWQTSIKATTPDDGGTQIDLANAPGGTSDDSHLAKKAG